VVAHEAAREGFARPRDLGGRNASLPLAALGASPPGSGNVAAGPAALQCNTDGDFNAGTGDGVLADNTTGAGNTATGDLALTFNTTGSYNVASGIEALLDNSSGRPNVATGINALKHNTVGDLNVAEGRNALLKSRGAQSRAFLAGVSGVAIAGPGQSVLVNANGQLGTATASSRALKRDVRPLGRSASRRLLSLHPVSYRYRHGDRRRQFGLIAERVAHQVPALVERAPNGKPAGVYYQELPALLLAQVKRQQRQIASQAKRIERQGKAIRALRARN
jgi:hypothetical protein